MPKPLLLLLCALVSGSSLTRAESAPTEFLRYIFGAEDVAIGQVAWPHDDLWMVPGAKNAAGLAEIAKLKLSPGKNDVVWEMIQQGLCVIQLREGKVDPAYNLDQIYFLQRQLALRFVYAALQQDKDQLARLVTEVDKVTFGRTKPAAQGDMDVYGELVGWLPVLRVSSAAEDMRSKSVTYRVPLGPGGLKLRMIKRGSQWVIDSSDAIAVPLEFFFR